MIRGYVTVLTGQGGVGKTALTGTTAISLALGVNLLDPTNCMVAWKLHCDRLRTYMYGLEDDFAEMKRRLKAVLDFHHIAPRRLDGYMFFGDGSVDRLILAIYHAAQRPERTELVDVLIKVLCQNQIDVLILDPLVKLHYCNENDNGSMDFVMTLLKEIAVKANCAIWVVHHSGKTGTSQDEHGGRGASAIPAAGRINETLTPATRKERDKYGFGADVVKLEHTKANMSARDEHPQWLRVRGWPVGNGDFAQVMELVDPKDQTARMDDLLFDHIVEALLNPPQPGYWISKNSGDNWIGKGFMAGGIGSEDRAELLSKDWLSRKVLVVDPDAKDDRKRAIKTALKLDEIAAAKLRETMFSTTSST